MPRDVAVYTTAESGKETSRAIGDSAATLGFESSQTRPPEQYEVEFIDWGFNSDHPITFEEHLETVRREQPEVAVAPDIEDDRDPATVYEQADQLLNHAEHVVIVPKDIEPSEVPNRFRVGVPLANFGSDAPWSLSEFVGVGDVHLLGGSPTVQLAVVESDIEVASVDGAAAINSLEQAAKVWTWEGEYIRCWVQVDEGTRYEKLRASLNNIANALNGAGRAAELPAGYDKREARARNRGQGAPYIEESEADLWSPQDRAEGAQPEAVEWAEDWNERDRETVWAVRQDLAADGAGFQYEDAALILFPEVETHRIKFLADAFEHADDFLDATEDQLLAIDGIGPATAEVVRDVLAEYDTETQESQMPKLEIRSDTSAVLKPAVKAVKQHTDTLRMEIGESAIRLRGRAPPAAMINVVLHSGGFDTFDTWGGGVLETNADAFYGAFGGKTDSVRVSVEDSELTVEIDGEETDSFAVSEPDDDEDADPWETPATRPAATATVNGGDLSNALRAAKKVGSSTMLGTSEAAFILHTEGDDHGEAYSVLEAGLKGDTRAGGFFTLDEGSSRVAAPYLDNFRKSIDRKNSTAVEIGLPAIDADEPLKAEFVIERHGQQAEVTFWQAPLIRGADGHSASESDTDSEHLDRISPSKYEAIGEPRLDATATGHDVKNWFRVMTAHVSEAKWRWDTDGLYSTFVEPANVMMYRVDLGAAAFESFETRRNAGTLYENDGQVGIFLDNAEDVLRLANKNDLVSIQIDADAQMAIVHDDYTVRLPTIDPDSVRQEPDIPGLDYSGRATVNTQDLYGGIQAIDDVTDHVAVYIYDGKVYLYGEDVESEWVEVDTAGGEGFAGSLYSLDYLTDYLGAMTKKSRQNTQIEIVEGVEFPILFKQTIGHTSAEITAMLAPRIATDENKYGMVRSVPYADEIEDHGLDAETIAEAEDLYTIEDNGASVVPVEEAEEEPEPEETDESDDEGEVYDPTEEYEIEDYETVTTPLGGKNEYELPAGVNGWEWVEPTANYVYEAGDSPSTKARWERGDELLIIKGTRQYQVIYWPDQKVSRNYETVRHSINFSGAARRTILEAMEGEREEVPTEHVETDDDGGNYQFEDYGPKMDRVVPPEEYENAPSEASRAGISEADREYWDREHREADRRDPNADDHFEEMMEGVYDPSDEDDQPYQDEDEVREIVRAWNDDSLLWEPSDEGGVYDPLGEGGGHTQEIGDGDDETRFENLREQAKAPEPPETVGEWERTRNRDSGVAYEGQLPEMARRESDHGNSYTVTSVEAYAKSTANGWHTYVSHGMKGYHVGRYDDERDRAVRALLGFLRGHTPTEADALVESDERGDAPGSDDEDEGSQYESPEQELQKEAGIHRAKADDILDEYGSLEVVAETAQAEPDLISAIDGIGDVTTEGVVEWAEASEYDEPESEPETDDAADPYDPTDEFDELEEPSEISGIGEGRRKTLDAIDTKDRLADVQTFDSLDEMTNAVREMSLAHRDGRVYMGPPDDVINRLESVYDGLPDEAKSAYLNDDVIHRRINAARKAFNRWMGKKKREQQIPSTMEAGPSNYPAKKANDTARYARKGREELKERIGKIKSAANGGKQRALEAIGTSIAEQNEKQAQDRTETLREKLAPGAIVYYRDVIYGPSVWGVKRLNKKSVRLKKPDNGDGYDLTTVDYDNRRLQHFPADEIDDLDADAIEADVADELLGGYDSAIRYLMGTEWVEDNLGTDPRPEDTEDPYADDDSLSADERATIADAASEGDLKEILTAVGISTGILWSKDWENAGIESPEDLVDHYEDRGNFERVRGIGPNKSDDIEQALPAVRDGLEDSESDTTDEPSEAPSETVVLVGCGKSKRDGVHAAADLYDSTYFAKKRAYAEQADRWYVLSAEHGIISPSESIEDYDRTAGDMEPEEVRELVRETLPDVSEAEVVILAGKDYYQPAGEVIDEHAPRVYVPTQGMGIGEQMSWLEDHSPPEYLAFDPSAFTVGDHVEVENVDGGGVIGTVTAIDGDELTVSVGTDPGKKSVVDFGEREIRKYNVDGGILHNEQLGSIQLLDPAEEWDDYTGLDIEGHEPEIVEVPGEDSVEDRLVARGINPLTAGHLADEYDDLEAIQNAVNAADDVTELKGVGEATAEPVREAFDGDDKGDRIPDSPEGIPDGMTDQEAAEYIHRRRSPGSQEMDESIQAREQTTDFAKWFNARNYVDFVGVDDLRSRLRIEPGQTLEPGHMSELAPDGVYDPTAEFAGADD